MAAVKRLRASPFHTETRTVPVQKFRYLPVSLGNEQPSILGEDHRTAKKCETFASITSFLGSVNDRSC